MNAQNYNEKLAGCSVGDLVTVRGSRVHKTLPFDGRVVRITGSTVVVDRGDVVVEVGHKDVTADWRVSTIWYSAR